MKKVMKYGLLFIALIALILFALSAVRKWSNAQVAENARIELKQWVTLFEKIPDEENGAILIQEGEKESTLIRKEKMTETDNFPEHLRDVEWTVNNIPDRFREDDFNLDCTSDLMMLRSFLDNNTEAMAKIEKGLDYEKWSYTQDFEKGPAATTPSLVAVKSMAQVFIYKGMLLERKGQSLEAMKEYMKGVKLSITLSHDPVLITRMIEVCVADMALKTVTGRIVNGNLSKEEIRYTLDELKNLYGLRGDFSKVYDVDYYVDLNVIEKYASSKGNLQLELYKGPRIYFLTPWIHDYANEVKILKQYREIATDVNPARLFEADAVIKEKKILEELGIMKGKEPGPNRSTLMRLELGAGDVTTAAVSMAQCEVYWRGTMIMASIKLFQMENKRLPTTLDEIAKYVTGENIVDPFSGKGFLYMTKADDFLLYSIGDNFKDDNGSGEHSFSGDGCPLLDPDIVIHRPLNKENKE